MMNCTGQEPKNVNDQHLNHGTTGWLGLQGTFRDHHITCPHPQLPGQGHLSLGQVAQSHLAGAAEVRGWDALGFVLGFL